MRRLLPFVFLVAGCGGRAAPATFVEPDVSSWPEVGPPSLQLYLVLTADPAAMQDEAAVSGMWDAVHGRSPRYAPIWRHVTWVPADYALDVDLDFAHLPHAAFSAARLAPMLSELPAPLRARAEQAKLAILFTSRVATLPGGNHVRLAGAAALYAADAYDGVIVDLLARRAWAPADWLNELSGAALSVRQRRFVGRADRLATRGNPKFGAPDLEMTGVTAANRAPAQARFAAADAALLAHGGQVGGTLSTADGPVPLLPCASQAADAGCVRVAAP